LKDLKDWNDWNTRVEYFYQNYRHFVDKIDNLYFVDGHFVKGAEIAVPMAAIVMVVVVVVAVVVVLDFGIVVAVGVVEIRDNLDMMLG
jgi:hypothetical protein